MSIKKGESGKIVRVASGGVDMSTNTELRLYFWAPSGGADFIRLTGSPSPVTIGTGVTDPTLGVLAADEYVEYKTEALDFDVDGAWQLQLEWEDTGTTPDTIIRGDCVALTIAVQDCDP